MMLYEPTHFVYHNHAAWFRAIHSLHTATIHTHNIFCWTATSRKMAAIINHLVN